MQSHNDVKNPDTKQPLVETKETPLFSESRKSADDHLTYPKSCTALPDGKIAIQHDEHISYWDPEEAQWLSNSAPIQLVSFIKFLPPCSIFGGSHNILGINSYTPIHREEYETKPAVIKSKALRALKPYVSYTPSGTIILNTKSSILVSFTDKTTEYIEINAPTLNSVYVPTALSDKCAIGFHEKSNSIFIFDLQNKKFIRDARLRTKPFDNSYAPLVIKIGVLSNQRFVIYFPEDKSLEFFKIDHEFNLSKQGTIPLPKDDIISLEVLINGTHFVTGHHTGSIKLWNVDTLDCEHTLNLPKELSYTGILCVRPTDGQVVYVTPETIGMIQYNCTLKYLNALRTCEYLTENVKNLPTDNIQLIGEYIHPDKFYTQTIKQNQKRLGLFDRMYQRKQMPDAKPEEPSNVPDMR